MMRFAPLFAVAVLLGFASPALAALQQVRVLAVGIDDSPTQALRKAEDYAKARAVYLVARKLPIDDVSARVAAMKPDQFKEIVRGAETLRTRREGSTTYAEVMVTVIDTVLRRALGLNEGEALDVSEAPVKMRGVLVLPVFVKENHPYLWEKENALREPLRAEVLRQAHGAVLVPAGDLDDLRLVDYSNVLSVKGEELEPMFKRYGADEIVIAIYTPTQHGKQPTEAGVILRRLTPTAGRVETLALNPDASGNLDDGAIKDAATVIAGAVTQIASSTASDDQARLAKATKIPVTFKYANPRELAQMQESLRNAAGVLMLTIPAISTGAITGVAYVEGEPQKLREKLGKTGMVVTQTGDSWQLSLR